MEFLADIGIVILKAALVLGALLHMAALTIWIERKAAALIQDRQGANRAAILGFDLAGVINTLIADPVKALFKEDFVPRGTSQFMHSMGPFLAVLPVLVSFAVVPFGPDLEIGGRTIALQLAQLNVGILYVFAMGSLAVYGVVLAGWVSRNKFSLFGGLRASAQMISYEITMGVSIVGVLAIYSSLDLAEIVKYQSGTFLGFLPNWGIFLNPLGFVLFFISMMAETKRAPFDLPESESELVAGYLTEYSGMKFMLFWLGEFAEIAVASAIITLLFLGGWQLPYIDITKISSDWGGILPGFFKEWNFQWAPLIGTAVFGAKTVFLCVVQVVLRWTLPRFRYDQLMNLCWKIMLPFALLNLVATVVLVLMGFY
ncbi:MAG: NADH-quinone oxidoreductase subunit NuoH [Bdellovibrionales bacterium]|nr:NADH-quinone oxidoreductase subunit NuoH [Bdellovibrionales bacterium]